TVQANMLLAWAMTRFTSDPQLNDLRAQLAGLQIQAWVASSTVAADAVMVPLGDEAPPIIRRAQKSGLAGNPSLILDQIDQRQCLEQARISRTGNPVGLIVMRTGPPHPGEAGARDLIRGELLSALHDVHHDVRVGHFGHKRFAFAVDAVCQPVRAKRGSIEGPQRRVWPSLLGHGPVIGPMPTGVLFRVAVATFGGSDIALIPAD